MMKQNLPNLIIAGAHKAATTSLYTYLAAHPDIYGSGKKEIDQTIDIPITRAT